MPDRRALGSSFPLIVAVALVALGHAAPAAGAQEGPVVRRAAPPSAPQSTDVPDQPVVVPFTYAGHLPVVEVMVDGEGPYRFALDTGASGLARADDDLVTALSLPSRGRVRARGAAGTTHAMELVGIGEIRVGDAVFRGITAASRDYGTLFPPEVPAIDGFLGFQLFADCVVSIDFVEQTLTLSTVPLPAADGETVLDLLSTRPPTVAIGVNGTPVEAVLDSGMRADLRLPDAMAAGNLAAEPVAAGTAGGLGGQFEIREAPLAGALRLGAFEIDAPTAMLDGRGEQVLIGYGILRDFRLTFDQRQGRMKLERRSPGSESGQAE